jgi:nucleoside-diphosphate-sugar epimerase
LKRALTKKKINDIFVYFSTCSIYDPTLKNSLYVKHKLKIENIIKNYDNYYIFRLPNVASKTTNNFTLINNLIYKLKNNLKITVLSEATRNIIDILDVVRIVDLILESDHGKNRIINIANKYNNKVIDIIFYLFAMLDCKTDLLLKKSLIKSSYPINIKYIKKYLILAKIKFSNNYYKKILDKYYGPKN